MKETSASDDAKKNILKGVNKKIRRRNIIIAACSAVLVIAIGVVAYIMLFVVQSPITADDYVENLYDKSNNGLPDCKEEEHSDTVTNAPCNSGSGEVIVGSGETYKKEQFSGVRAYTKYQTINELDDRALDYNQIVMPMELALLASLDSNWHTHVENNADGTATLYFYMSENLINKTGFWSEGTAEIDILFGWHQCDTCEEGTVLNPITKIYYLVYDYDNFSKEGFENVRDDAVLLWDKSTEDK